MEKFAAKDKKGIFMCSKCDGKRCEDGYHGEGGQREGEEMGVIEYVSDSLITQAYCFYTARPDYLADFLTEKIWRTFYNEVLPDFLAYYFAHSVE
jgi:hypothetical protein